MSPPLSVLAVDDEADIRATLSEYFEAQSIPVFTAKNGAEMYSVIEKEEISVVLLDLNLAGEDGFDLCRALRKDNPSLGIVILTGAGDTIDRVVGLEMGADDYVSKPFELRELLARIRSVHRRLAVTPVVEDSGDDLEEIQFGDNVLNTARRTLKTFKGEIVTLGGMEYDLLKAFIDNAGRVLSRDQLLNLAHKRDWDPFDRSIDVRITRLRKKIEERPAQPKFLRTVRGVGYIFTLDGVGD